MAFQAWEDFLYPGTDVLRNKAGLRDAGELERFERNRTAGRLVEIRAGLVVLPGRFDLAHVQAIHAHVFQDVYEWAGQVRSFPLFKGGSEFCRPEHLESYAVDVFGRLGAADYLRGLPRDEFVNRAADVLGDLNALHPFREGNGRSQRAFVELLAKQAGHRIVWPAAMEHVNVAASVASLRGDNRGLVELLDRSVARAGDAPPHGLSDAPSAAQLAATSFPRPFGRVRPAAAQPRDAGQGYKPRPPGLSL